MIKLPHTDGTETWVNPDHIITMKRMATQAGGQTLLRLTGNRILNSELDCPQLAQLIHSYRRSLAQNNYSYATQTASGAGVYTSPGQYVTAAQLTTGQYLGQAGWQAGTTLISGGPPSTQTGVTSGTGNTVTTGPTTVNTLSLIPVIVICIIAASLLYLGFTA